MTDYDTIVKTMTDKFTALSGIVPDAASDIGIRLKVLAAEVFSLLAELEGLRRELFPTTAQGGSLDLHAQTRGLARKEATPSAGVLRFLRQTPAVYELSIPAHTLCQTEQGGVHCETTADCVLNEGALYADAPARSVETGEGANVAAGRVTVFGTAVQGVYAVTNPEPFTGGSEGEDDDALRARLLAGYRTIANGTNAAFYYNEAMKYGFVHSASVLPRARGVGTVDVVAAGKGEALSAEQMALIQEGLAEQKEICVDVQVIPPVLRPVEVAVAVTPRDEYGFEGVKTAVEACITGYLAEKTVGAPLHTAELSNLVYGLAGVYNHHLTLPAQDIPAAPDELITLGALTVTRLMG